MHYTVEHLLPHDIAEHLHVPHISGTTKLIGAGLSAVALAVGGFLGYNFYWTRKWDSWEWVQASSFRQSIHTFLWNRWYMNAAFYKVFVDGVINLGQGIYDTIESKVLIPLSDVVANISHSISESTYDVVEDGLIFGLINKGVPATIIAFYSEFRKSQTGILSINIAYIVFLLLVLILGMVTIGGI
jgi:NADH-quinone oxidoreductase subunit L